MSEAFNAEDQVWDDFVIRGTCRNLEKSFFRLTAVPDPADVRPEPVLQEALARLVRLLAESSVRYLYAVDQFKVRPEICRHSCRTCTSAQCTAACGCWSRDPPQQTRQMHRLPVCVEVLAAFPASSSVTPTSWSLSGSSKGHTLGSSSTGQGV